MQVCSYIKMQRYYTPNSYRKFKAWLVFHGLQHGMRGAPFIFTVIFVMPTSRNNLGLGIVEKLHCGKMSISFDSFLKSQKMKFKKEW